MTSQSTHILLETHRVPQLDTPQRLQEYAVSIFRRLHSRKGTKKAIKNGLIFVNGSQGYTGDWIKGGEELSLFESSISKKPTLDLDLDVLYEDDYLAIVYKPPGILVSGNKRFTLENALPHNLDQSKQEDRLLRPEPIHRLDYPTTGAILIGKTAKAVVALNALFENKQITKTYVAVTQGNMDEKGTVDLDIDGKPATSLFQKIDAVPSERFQTLNLVLLEPQTGRRHQLRKHMASKGTPILGDRSYSPEDELLKGKGLYLHAYSLEFLHPISKERVLVSAPLPKKYTKLFPKLPFEHR